MDLVLIQTAAREDLQLVKARVVQLSTDVPGMLGEIARIQTNAANSKVRLQLARELNDVIGAFLDVVSVDQQNGSRICLHELPKGLDLRGKSENVAVRHRTGN